MTFEWCIHKKILNKRKCFQKANSVHRGDVRNNMQRALMSQELMLTFKVQKNRRGESNKANEWGRVESKRHARTVERETIRDFNLKGNNLWTHLKNRNGWMIHSVDGSNTMTIPKKSSCSDRVMKSSMWNTKETEWTKLCSGTILLQQPT